MYYDLKEIIANSLILNFAWKRSWEMFWGMGFNRFRSISQFQPN